MRCLILFLSLTFPMLVLANEFEIFTLGNKPVNESNATVYYLDQGDELLRAINQEMSSLGVTSEEQGKHYATPELSEALINQIKGLLRAGHYQLKYFPAVVVDGQYVIYGTTDIRLFKEMKP